MRQPRGRPAQRYRRPHSLRDVRPSISFSPKAQKRETWLIDFLDRFWSSRRLTAAWAASSVPAAVPTESSTSAGARSAVALKGVVSAVGVVVAFALVLV